MNAPLMAALMIAAPPEAPTAEPFATADVIHVGRDRPACARFRVSVDGRSPDAARDAYLADLFAFLDRDGDGALTGPERALAPAAADLAAVLGQTHAGFYTAPAAAAGDELRPDERGRVTPAAFLDYYRPRLPAVRVVVQTERGDRAEALTEALFRALAKDDRVTKREAEEAAQRFAKFDADENDLITPDEVAEFAAGAAVRKRDVFVLTGDAVARTSEAKKLAGIADLMPGAEFAVRLGRRVASEPPLTDISPKAAVLANAIRGAGSGFRVGAETTRLDVSAGEAADDRAKRARAFLAQQFKTADAKGKGHLDTADAARPQFRFLGPILRLADRDADGRLTEKELAAWFDLQDAGRRNFVTVVMSDEGRDLFGLLDANRDGRLDPREARGVWARLTAANPKAEAVSRADLPRIVQLAFAQGPSDGVPPAREPPAPASGPKAAPEWLGKMDRNGDGYVSRKEWLGPPARFAELDRDGDGLIDAAEAEAAGRAK